MNKLPDVRGRITYISSHAKQENLYAVYETTDRRYWRELAKCNKQEFLKSGTEGKCIEAREFIIALPESFPNLYEPDKLLQLFTDRFKEKYGVECVSALHHNKRKTNYHIHLIFSERELLPEPIEKTATRNMFYDEQGKHVRTKKEILDENGNIRKGCKIVKKGEIYERNLFTAKNKLFKQENFTDEVKHFYTDLMIVSGVVKTEIRQIKQEYITDRIRESVDLFGNKPERYGNIIMDAVIALALLISKVLEKAREMSARLFDTELIQPQTPKQEPAVSPPKESQTESKIPPKPVMSTEAAAYPNLLKIYKELNRQNGIIFDAERERNNLEIERDSLKGLAKLTKKGELQSKIDRKNEEIDILKIGLSGIVKRYGFHNVHDFYKAYASSKEAYAEYRDKADKWEEVYGENTQKPKKESVHERLQNHQQKMAERQVQQTAKSRDRGAR